jgi:hypothetical protein
VSSFFSPPTLQITSDGFVEFVHENPFEHENNCPQLLFRFSATGQALFTHFVFNVHTTPRIFSAVFAGKSRQ